MEFDGSRMIPAHCEGTSLYLEHVARYRFAARFAANRRVLDAACGVGYGSHVLAEAGAKAVLGVDLEAEAVAYARAHFDHPVVEFRIGDVSTLADVPNDSVDLYVSFETIEHVEDAEAAVRAARRVLADGGIFVASTPNWNVSRNRNPHHVREFTRDQFAVLLAAEFPHVEILPQFNALAVSIGETGGDGELDRQDWRSRDEEEAPYYVAVASDRPVDVGRSQWSLGGAADTEANHQHIQTLEGGVADRDRELEHLRGELAQERAAVESERLAREDAEARLAELDVARQRREVVVAQRLVHAAVRLNRMFGKVPTRAYRAVRRIVRRQVAPALPGPLGVPDFSVVVPVYDNVAYLRDCFDSVLAQETSASFELVLYDDASPDPGVAEVLAEYEKDRRVRIVRRTKNLGISRATNQALGYARGRWIAFLDCDDRLDPSALEEVRRYCAAHPRVSFVYTNRLDIDEAGHPRESWDFVNRSFAPPAEELLKGMFASHLKVIERNALERVGLFRPEFDGSQDYDFVLRAAEHCEFGFLGKELYQHRVHARQTTQSDLDGQARLAEEAKRLAIRRRALRAGEGPEVTIVVLSLNRLEDTKRCLRFLRERTDVPYRVILVDNGSDPAVVEELRRVVAAYDEVTLHETGQNLGCGGGRNVGVGLATTEYVAFLDNDIEVTSGWLSPLLLELEENADLAACCARVVFPNDSIQFSGGSWIRAGRRIRFDLRDTGKARDDLSTLEVAPCDWVPGGATIYRRELLVRVPYDEAIAGAYEDNDWCLALADQGYSFAGCGASTVIHHHIEYNDRAKGESDYLAARYDRKRLRLTLKNFAEKHGCFIEEEELYRFVGYEGSDDFIREITADSAAPSGEKVG